MRKVIAFGIVIVLVAVAVGGYWYSRNSVPQPQATDASVVASAAVAQPAVVPPVPPVQPSDASQISPPAKYPADSTLIDADPVTGRSSEVDIAWLDTCLSMGYDLEIAKDPDFRWMVFTNVRDYDNPSYILPADPNYPAFIIGSGQKLRSPGIPAGTTIQLEAGHTYYYHVRTSVAYTGQVIHSRWSDTKSFTVKSG